MIKTKSAFYKDLAFIYIFIFVFIFPLITNLVGNDSAHLPRLSLLKFTILVLFCFWVLIIMEDKQVAIIKTPLNLPISFFFLWSLMATAFSINLSTSITGEAFGWRYDGILTLSLYLLLFFFVSHLITTRRQIEILIATLISSTSLVSIYAIFQRFGYDFIPTYLYGGFDLSRSFATFSNAFFLGTFLTLLFPLSFILLTTKHNLNLSRPLLFISTPIIFTALIFTFTRSAWVASLLAILIIIIYCWRSFNKLILLISIGLLLSVIFFSLLPSPYKTYNLGNRLASVIKIDQSSNTRLVLYKIAWRVTKDYPILGTGPDTFGLIFPKYRPANWTKLSGAEFADKVHNESLQIAATTGVVGFIFYLWLIVAIFRYGFQSIRAVDGNNVNDRALLMALSASLIAYIVQIQFGFSEVTTAPVFWFLLALLVSAARQNKITKINISVGKGGVIYPVLFIILFYGSYAITIPLRADYHIRQALDLESRIGLDSAISHYEAASYLIPSEEYLSATGKAYYRLAKQTQDKFYFLKSVKHLKKAIKVNPLDERAYIDLGKTYVYAGLNFNEKYFNKAEKALKQATKLDPNFAPPHIELGVALSKQKKIAEAIKEWKIASKLDPSLLDSYFYLASTYLDNGEKEKAIKEYEKIIKINPKIQAARKIIKKLKGE